MSISSFRQHKMRTLLTMLGIIFGVGAVISMISIGAGARQTALTNIESLGLNNIIINNKQGADLSNNDVLLNDKDLSTITDILPEAKLGTGVLNINAKVNYKSTSKKAEVWGTTPNYFQLMDLNIEQGGYFSSLDNKKYNKVCILGNSLSKQLFKSKSPLGKLIQINNSWFTVVGILKYKPIRTVNNNEINFNNRIYIPINSLRRRFNRDPKEPELDQIITRIDNSENIESAAGIIRDILSNNHNDNNFELLIPEQLLEQKQETLEIFNIVMGAIAGISLLVGGIGIMNIMLASVMERTHEIGIRRAVGATKSDIKRQFLSESVLISGLGGIMGIILGFLLSSLVSIYSGWNTIITFWSILLSVGLSSLVGIIFGYFPARKAANLDPINALRHE